MQRCLQVRVRLQIYTLIAQLRCPLLDECYQLISQPTAPLGGVEVELLKLAAVFKALKGRQTYPADEPASAGQHIVGSALCGIVFTQAVKSLIKINGPRNIQMMLLQACPYKCCKRSIVLRRQRY